MNTTPRILIVGLGSPHGDDQFGWRVVDELLPRVAGFHDVCVRSAAVPLDLVDWLEGIGRLHVCDACGSDRPPGTALRLEAAPSDDGKIRIAGLGQLRAGGSHDFGLAAVLRLAARLGRLPQKVVVHAVCGRRYEPGSVMEGAVAARVPQVASTILEELIHARDVARAVTAESG